MKYGNFYGIGIGPGDPELITVKSARILNTCKHVIVPKARIKSDSIALHIAHSHLSEGATIHELVFPMTTDHEQLRSSWRASASTILEILQSGDDACFLTLGDPMVYSTYIYLLRELQQLQPALHVSTVPGITSFCASSALTNFALGEGKDPIIIIPTEDDLTPVRNALQQRGTVVLMKIGNRLPAILELLTETKHIDHAVLVHRAGHPDQEIFHQLKIIDPKSYHVGYLSIILIHSHPTLA